MVVILFAGSGDEIMPLYGFVRVNGAEMLKPGLDGVWAPGG